MTAVPFLELTYASDTALVDAIAERHEDALGEVYRRYAAPVRAVAQQPLPSGDLAEEAVQDAFFQLWSSPERFNPHRGSLRTYLQVQAYRRAIDVGRSEKSRHRREERDARRTTTAGGVEDEVIAHSVARQLRGALTRLDPKERQALELAYFAGHSYRQVAALLGQPEGTVKNRIRAGLHRLRSMFARAPRRGENE